MQDKEAAREQSKAKGKAIKVFIKKGVKGLHVVCSGLFVEHAIYCRRVLYCRAIAIRQPGSTTHRL